MINFRELPWGQSGKRYPKHFEGSFDFFLSALGKISYSPKSSKQKLLDLWKNARV